MNVESRKPTSAHTAEQLLKLREASAHAPWGEHDAAWAGQTKMSRHSRRAALHGAPVIVISTLEH